MCVATSLEKRNWLLGMSCKHSRVLEQRLLVSPNKQRLLSKLLASVCKKRSSPSVRHYLCIVFFVCTRLVLSFLQGIEQQMRAAMSRADSKLLMLDSREDFIAHGAWVYTYTYHEW